MGKTDVFEKNVVGFFFYADFSFFLLWNRLITESNQRWKWWKMDYVNNELLMNYVIGRKNKSLVQGKM